MIGAYIDSLYNNCKALARTEGYNAQALTAHFNTAIQQAISRQGFATEAHLLDHLIKKKYAELGTLFQSTPFLHIFYLVNSIGEYNLYGENSDALGRYDFEKSVQQQTGITTNLVLDLIKETVKTDAVLSSHFKLLSHNSYFFLSHDIDSLYGSAMQDGLWALKHKRFDVMLKVFAHVLTARPHWFNIDKIMELESEYDFRSTFYWLVNKGKIDSRQTNSDYAINAPLLTQTLALVREKGFENGLHKSISADTFKAELGKLPQPVPGNRYHYLKYQLPGAYDEIETSGLKLDASLGFAEHYGFRNNYGYPFSPYNMQSGKPYSFIEVPLTLMDGTFQRYMKVPVSKTADTVIGFLEKNKKDCLLSILWHNTFFTDYKYRGYKGEYIRILKYLHEQRFSNINQSGIIELFSWKN